jgi:hypothetical protein
MKVGTTSCGSVAVTSAALWGGVQVRERDSAEWTVWLHAKVTQVSHVGHVLDSVRLFSSLKHETLLNGI